MKKISLALIVVIALVVPLILAACQTSAGESKPATQNLSIIMGEGKIVQEINGKEELTGEFHRWEPDVLVVNKGDKVVLTVTNPRGHAHSFILPEFGVATQKLESRGGSATVEFNADKAGVFQYACATPFNEETGDCGADHQRQVGYLIVLER